MVKPVDPAAPDLSEPPAPPARVTRGFLFADLRGYTAFTEAHGDTVAGNLLDAYRRIVRRVVAQFGGAEVKTEGDSFYVVFPSATAAVSCGIAIVAATAAATRDQPELPINAAVGVHAGETADTEEGYVGSAVNVAARLCAAALTGEVLVSDTVRGLTRTGGDIRYIPRGHRRLKGIAEPIAVFAAADAQAAVAGSRRLLPLGGGASWRNVELAAAIVVVVAVGAFLLSRGIPGTGSGATATPAIVPTPPASQLGSASPTAALASPSIGPSPSSQFPELPFGHEAPPGHYILSRFYMTPDLELPAAWTLGICRGLPPQPCKSEENNGYDPELVQLRRADRPASALVLLHPTELLSDPCANPPFPTIAPGDSFLDWMRRQPALRVSEAVPRWFRYVHTSQVEISVIDDKACPFQNPHEVSLRQYSDATTFFWLETGQVVRVFAVTIPSGVYAFVIAPNQDEFNLVDPQAESVLDTLHFPAP